ncbi:hypothetical protein [Bacillus sp. T3]|uniref:hypothetical protein n=1 Tax=Bacillus sp. T3 TaxID=467262 RepID=UPI00298175E3|nr:hypothetical protein [Bacillus sp. T3]
MMKTYTPILMIVIAGLLAIKNRYKLIGFIFRSSFTRRFLVSTLLSMPAVRNKMMQMVFSKPVQS